MTINSVMRHCPGNSRPCRNVGLGCAGREWLSGWSRLPRFSLPSACSCGNRRARPRRLWKNRSRCSRLKDEILTRLSKIADLKVISRTSTQKYKSAPTNLPEIARQLGVAHILEGSVQKSGDSIRVNVQLINAANDSHLWADTFDRKLTDIFSVESEVAKAIADQLRAKLTGEEEQVIAA